MVEVVKGDLLDANEQYICHQVNTMTTKAAHLAKSVFERFPYADVYSDRKKRDNLGDIIIRGKVIALVAQKYPGKWKYDSDAPDIRYNAFYTCLKKVFTIPDIKSVAFPWRIGCGSAGGDWDMYFEMILDVASKHPDVRVRIYMK